MADPLLFVDSGAPKGQFFKLFHSNQYGATGIPSNTPSCIIGIKDILIIGLLLNDSMLCKPKKDTVSKLKLSKNVYIYVMDGVNCDTVYYLVYKSPYSQKLGCGCGPNLSITVL